MTNDQRKKKSLIAENENILHGVNRNKECIWVEDAKGGICEEVRLEIGACRAKGTLLRG